ncbi:MAG TPA: permease-like cell division protein FtsX [Acidimicrobiales bacterium]|nr:permease-like cell division protein FtsX [Acidimicrobiales bacterium]
MAISVEYVVKETSTNLWRNWMVSVAAVVTVAFSLSFVGVALLFRQEVDNATSRWQSGVTLAIFMNGNVNSIGNPQAQAVKDQLSNMPQVAKASFCNQNCAFTEYQKMFQGDPTMQSAINNPNELPVSFRIKLSNASEANAVGAEFNNQPGVQAVEYAKGEVEQLLKLSNFLQVASLVAAAALLVSSVVLILNSIRLAIFSRRKEVEVMKLVGATNWFIRIPFMAEGLIQGLVGAVIGCGLTTFFVSDFRKLISENKIQLLQPMTASTSEIVVVYILLLVFGAIVGAGGSAMALRRFLDV